MHTYAYICIHMQYAPTLAIVILIMMINIHIISYSPNYSLRTFLPCIAHIIFQITMINIPDDIHDNHYSCKMINIHTTLTQLQPTCLPTRGWSSRSLGSSRFILLTHTMAGSDKHNQYHYRYHDLLLTCSYHGR